MPTITNNVGSVVPSVSAATIAGYRAAFAQGLVVRRADILNIISLYNTFRSHSHQNTVFNDYYWVRYGNLPNPPTTIGTTTLGGMSPVLGAFPTVAQGNNILASDVNGFAATVSAIPSTHYHPMTDISW